MELRSNILFHQWLSNICRSLLFFWVWIGLKNVAVPLHFLWQPWFSQDSCSVVVMVRQKLYLRMHLAGKGVGWAVAHLYMTGLLWTGLFREAEWFLILGVFWLKQYKMFKSHLVLLYLVWNAAHDVQLLLHSMWLKRMCCVPWCDAIILHTPLLINFAI